MKNFLYYLAIVICIILIIGSIWVLITPTDQVNQVFNNIRETFTSDDSNNKNSSKNNVSNTSKNEVTSNNINTSSNSVNNEPAEENIDLDNTNVEDDDENNEETTSSRTTVDGIEVVESKTKSTEEISEKDARKLATKQFKKLGEDVKKDDFTVSKILRNGEEYYYIVTANNSLEIKIKGGQITRINSELVQEK